MAAVTIVNQRSNVVGSYREKYYTVNIAADLDTLVTGFRVIRTAIANSQAAANNNIGCTVSGGTITFQTGGAETGAQVQVTGL